MDERMLDKYIGYTIVGVSSNPGHSDSIILTFEWDGTRHGINGGAGEVKRAEVLLASSSAQIHYTVL